MICADCAAALTAEEVHYYAGRCEVCERAWHDRLGEWMAGAPDPELDQMYRAPPPTRH